METDYLLVSVPAFLVLILLELGLSWVRGRPVYRTGDAINSLSTGILFLVVGFVAKSVTLGSYFFVYEAWKLVDAPLDSAVVWVVGVLAYDAVDYWVHRATHRVNVLWGWHSVHHQSEDFNLTTAIRQPALPIYEFFFLPLAILGVPPAVFFAAGAINRLFAFAAHTQFIPKLGILERIFVTPSNHRVHHGQNARYLDKNFGGILIVWDKLFGSYQEELDEDPIVYGNPVPLRSWNPLWANVHHWAQLGRDAWETRSLWDKLRIWFMPTGWRPEDVKETRPLEAFDLERQDKFDASVPLSMALYCWVQFAIAVFLSVGFMGVELTFSRGLVGVLTLGAWLGALGILLENRPTAPRWELCRIAATAGSLSWFCFELSLPAATWLPLIGLYALVSAGVLLAIPAPRARRVAAPAAAPTHRAGVH